MITLRELEVQRHSDRPEMSAETRAAPTWVSDLQTERPLIGESLGYEPETIPVAISRALAARADDVQYITADGARVTLAEFVQLSRRVSRACIAVGMRPGDGAGIIGFNSVEWFASDIGITMAAGVVAGIYTTNRKEIVGYVLRHSRSVVCFVDDEEALGKVLSVKADCDLLKMVVVWGGLDLSKYPDHRSYVLTWEEFLDLGKDVDDAEVRAREETMKPQDCCKLIYTSGTTGPPKAVMISHDNITFTVKAVTQFMQIRSDDVLVSFLPPSHIAANMVDIMGAVIGGFTMHLARPDALKGSLVETLRTTRPTVFLAVPRVWEKIQEKMLSVGANNGPLKKLIAGWAKGIGSAACDSLDRGGGYPIGFRLANLVVFQNVRAALGLDRCRLLFNTAAPLQKVTDDYFRSLYLRIVDLYGMSEATGPLTVNSPEYRRGTSGKVIPGVEVKLVNKDDTGEGELCFRGRNIFMGYSGNEEESAATIDPDGFLHTGDLGRVDADGFISITGRAKELLVTSGGENVAPSLVEMTMMSAMSALSRVIAFGDKRKFISCLVVPYMDTDGTLIGPAALVNPDVKTASEAVADDKWAAYIDAGIAAANEEAVSNAAKVRKAVILTKDFSIEDGELTPTMKMKRKVVAEKYSSVVSSMYI